jgi:hypothetical protein
MGTLTHSIAMLSQVNQGITGYREIYIVCLIQQMFCFGVCNFSAILPSGSRWQHRVRGWQCKISEILADFCCLEIETFRDSLAHRLEHLHCRALEQRHISDLSVLFILHENSVDFCWLYGRIMAKPDWVGTY